MSVRINGKVQRMSSLDAGFMNLKANMLKGDPKAFTIMLKMMTAAGMIKAAQESEPEASMSPDDQDMFTQALTIWGLDGSSKEWGRE